MDFGIVGGGPASLSILERIIEKVEAGEFKKDATVTIFEKSAEFGRGLPYSKKTMHSDLRLNISADEEGISTERESFHNWLSTQPNHVLKQMGIKKNKDGEVPADGCYSRSMAMGAYLENYGQELLKRAQAAGLKVDLKLNSEVVDMVVAEDGSKKVVYATENGLEQKTLNSVWLGLGHWSPADPQQQGDPIVFNSAWPAKKLETIHPGSVVGVVGTGPTGADVVIMLGHHNGSFSHDANGKCIFTPKPGADGFKAIMASKSGLLPQLRGPIDMEEYVTEEDFLSRVNPKTGFLPLNEVFDVFRTDMKNRYPEFAATIPGLDKMGFVDFTKWLESDFDKRGPTNMFQDSLVEARKATAEGKPIPLQDVFINLYVFSEIQKLFSAEDKALFSNYVKPVISKVNAPLPPEIAEKLEAMMDAGVLELRKQTVTDPAQAFQGEVNCIINATGQSQDMSKNPNRFVQNLVRRDIFSAQTVQFENPDQSAEFSAQHGLQKKMVLVNGKPQMSIGGVAVDDNYNVLNSKGDTVPGVYYVGPNNTRPYDPYSLIHSRDASHIVADKMEHEWNNTQKLTQTAQVATPARPVAKSTFSTATI